MALLLAMPARGVRRTGGTCLRRLASLIALLFAVAAPNLATPQSFGKAASAEWTVVSAPGITQHGLSCFAIYNGRQQVKLYANSFSISFRGRAGTNSYAYRLDDNPPVRILFPNPAEQEIGTFSLEGDEFKQLRRAKRFRLQAAPVFSSVIIEDIDLSAMPDILTYIHTARRCAP